MPVFDIIPPKERKERPEMERKTERIEKTKRAEKVEKKIKEIEIKDRKEKKEIKIKKVFSRPIIIGTIFFLVFLLSFLSVLKFSIAEKTLTKNFYPTRCEGDWQNPGNAAGLPDLSEKAGFDEFSEKNSAFYSSGSQELVCKWFDETAEQKKEPKTKFCGENNEKCKIKSAKLYLSLAIDELKEKTEQKENQTEVKEKNQEEVQSQISTTPQNQTSSLSTSDIDTKIILWYSTDHGKTWNSFAKITTLPLSNSLNNGYISFDAPFIKAWQDIENLRVMLEGVIGGEEKISAFLDGMWVKVEVGVKREIKIKLLSKKKSFKRGEIPTLEFENNLGEIGASVEILNYSGKKIDIPIEILGNKIQIRETKNLKPGVYKIKIKYKNEEGKDELFEQEFAYGVLAINFNKSIYLPNEEAYIQMAALRADGHTLCDANLKLEINSPSGEKFIFSTDKNTIQKSGSCGPNNVVDVPDYFLHFSIKEIGRYKVKLINADNNYEIEDSFEVKDTIPFEIERIGPTRIYPKAPYEIVFKIKTNENFKGKVKEYIPLDFEVLEPNQSSEFNIISLNKNQTEDQNKSFLSKLIYLFRLKSVLAQENENLKVLEWKVDWRAGETYELRYKFDAPNVSPYFYLLGPLKLFQLKETDSENSEKIIFEEARQWQIASDALSTRQNFYTESTAQSTTTNTAYQDKATLTFTPDDNSTYLIVASWLMQESSVSYQVKAKLTRTTGVAKDFNEIIYQPKDTTDYISGGAIAIDSFGYNAGSQTYKIQYATNNAAGTARIQEAKIFAIKLTHFDQYANSETRTTTTSTSYQDKTTLTFTPSSTGDYIILASATADGSSTSYDFRTQLTIDGTAYSNSNIEPAYASNRYFWGMVKRVNLTAASHTIKIQYSSENTGATAGIAHARIIALRADQFYNNYFAETEARTTTTSTSYQNRTTLTQTPQAADHFIVGSMGLDVASASYSVYGQLIRSATYGEMLIETKDTTNQGYPYFAIKKETLTNTSTTWNMQWRAENASYAAGIKDARVSVLELRFPAPSLSQNHYRWRDDYYGLNSNGGWLASEDTAYSYLSKGETTRLRIEIANTSGGSAEDYQYRLEYAQRSGGTCGDDETFTAVPVTATTEHFEMVDSAQYTDNEYIITGFLTGVGTRTYGKGVEDSSNKTSALDIESGYYAELEYAIKATTNASASTYCFRVTNDGSTEDFTYSTYPQITVDTSSANVSQLHYRFRDDTTASMRDFTFTNASSPQALGTTEPDVIKVGSTYYMYNRGNDADNDSIVVQSSTDGATWTNHGVIIEPGASGAWDDTYTIAPSVYYYSGTYYLFYEGNDGSHSQIGYATSTSPTGPFTKYASNPVLSNTGSGWESVTVGTPVITRANSKWYLFYHGYNGTNDQGGVAWSTDLTSWTRHSSNPIIPISSGQWDALKTAPSSVLILDNTIYVFYEGESTETPIPDWQIGIAYVSLSNLESSVMTKHSSNPILGPSASGWDDDWVQLPGIVNYGNGNLWMYYSGHNSGGAFWLGRSDNSGTSWKTAEDTAITGQAKNENLRVRFTMKNSGGTAQNYQFRLQVAQKTESTCEAQTTGWSDVPTTTSGCGTSVACITDSVYFNEQDYTTNLLTTEGTFRQGYMVEDSASQTNSITLNYNYSTEVEYNFKFTNYASDGATYCLRVTNAGTALNSYNSVASVTLASAGISLSGNAYENETSTVLSVCNGSTNVISLRVGNTTYGPVPCSASDGSFTITGISQPPQGDPMILWIDNQTPKATTITKYSGSGNVTGVELRKDRLLIMSDYGNVTNSDLDTWDSGNDSDIIYSVSSNNLTLADGYKLIVNTGDTYQPGGTITTSPSSDYTTTDGDILIKTSATLNMESYDLSIGGDLTNQGTLTLSSNQTTTFTATATGHTIAQGSSEFENVTFNGTGGGWQFNSSTTVNKDLTMTAGTLSGTQNITVYGGDTTGNGTITLTGGTFTLDGTGNFGGSSANWTFYNLTFGDGTGSETTTKTGNNDITISNVLTVASNQTLDGGSGDDDTWTLSGTGTPFVLNGSFTTLSATFSYTGNGATNVTGTTYGRLSIGTSNSANITYTALGNITAYWEVTLQSAASGYTNTFDMQGYNLLVGNPNYANSGDIVVPARSAFTQSASGTTTIRSYWWGAQNNAYLGGAGSTTFYNLQIGYTNDLYPVFAYLAGNITVLNNLTITSAGTNNHILDVTTNNYQITVGGNWTNNDTFYCQQGTVIFNDAGADTTKTITDGGEPFYDMVFNGAGDTWTYQDAASSAPTNSTTVQAGTANFINARTGTVSVTGGTLNVDWYLATHLVSAENTSVNIDTGDNDITISENSSTPYPTVFRYNGGWGSGATSQTTGTDSTGLNPQPENTGAIRIREYTMTNSSQCPGSGCILYKYNLQVDWQANYGYYDYYEGYGQKYLTSCLSGSSSSCGDDSLADDTIGQNWYRQTPSTQNGTKPYDGLNEPPYHGTWYVGMITSLDVSISDYDIDFGTIEPGSSPTNQQNTITVSTGASHGYIVYTFSTQALTHTDYPTITIPDWTGTNSSPTIWTTGEGFGYSTNDYTLTGGTPDRFSGPKYAGFSHTGPGDPVADRTGPTLSSDGQNTITYRLGTLSTQTAGNYTTTVVFVVVPEY